jgi:hypothetical protein
VGGASGINGYYRLGSARSDSAHYRKHMEEVAMGKKSVFGAGFSTIGKIVTRRPTKKGKSKGKK